MISWPMGRSPIICVNLSIERAWPMPQSAWNPTICVGLPYRLAVTTMMRPQLIVWSGLGYVRRALLIGILFEKKMAIPRHLEDKQGLVAEAQKGPAPPFTQF